MLSLIVCLSVCLQQVGVVERWLNLGSHKQPQGLLFFFDAKNIGEISTKSPQRGRQIEVG